MKAIDRLYDARVSMGEGKFQRALDQLLWLHENSLIEDPAFQGVRLSYALADWVELGAMYPKALQVLRTTRDKKANNLLARVGQLQDFIDVSAINEYLLEDRATYDLFIQLRHIDPGLAENCAELALPAVVKASDFFLAKMIYGDPKARISAMTKSLNEDIKWAKTREATHQTAALSAFVTNYVEDIQMLLKTFAVANGPEHIASLRLHAIKSVADNECRLDVDVKLLSSS